MTDPSSPHVHGRGPGRPGGRRLAGAAAAGVLGVAVLGPALLAAPPAVAAPPNAPCPPSFGATASAELLGVRLVDGQPLGLSVAPLADVHVSTTRSGIAGGPQTPRAAAEAKYLDARVAGLRVPTGILGTRVAQQAPPTNAVPSHVPTAELDLGVVGIGTGGLSAHATWAAPRRCEPDSGPRATAGATLVAAHLLPRGGGDVVRVTGLSSTTKTEVVREGSRAGAAATATAGLAEVRLFGGTVVVKVISQPALRVVAAGSASRSTVEYTSPVLEVTVNGGDAVRLDAGRTQVELQLPVPATPSTTELPLVGQLFGSLAQPSTPSARTVAVRIALGALDKDITNAGVHARAASIEVSVALCTGPEVRDRRRIVDVGLGVLEAAASAPHQRPPGYGGGDDDDDNGGGGTGSPAPSTPPSPSVSATPSPSAEIGGGGGGQGTESGDLPVTGSKLLWVAAIGVLMVIAGRGLLLLARRRSAL